MPRKYSNRRASGRTRKTYRKKRTVRKRRTVRRVSNKRILNVASTKKRDTMAAARFDNGTNKWVPTSMQPTSDGAIHTFMWCPTYRYSNTSNPRNSRVNQTVYYRGIAERYQFKTLDARAWQWRRIVFWSDMRWTSANGADADNVTYWRNVIQDSPDAADVQSYLFEGTVNTEYVDIFSAKVDNKRAKVVSDTNRVIAPPTSAGVIRGGK